MKKVILILVINTYLFSNTIIHKDCNSTIERLDINVWDPLYYQYKLVNNLPYQYNKKTKKYFWNPIYPYFFYKDYLRKYQESKNVKYLYEIEKLTNALLNKSTKFNYKNKTIRTLYYEGSGDVARMFHRHYSGLTNSYYVNIFSQLYKITGNTKYKKYAIEFFNSLTVPISEGGLCIVMLK
jgi:hypothetical protein